MTTLSGVQVIPDEALSAFATVLRADDFHHAYSDDARVVRAGEAQWAELVRMGRALPRGEVMALYELKCRREYGDESWWSRFFETDPIPGAMAQFEAAMDRSGR